MFFEIVSWLYITLICLLWGNFILKVFLGREFALSVDFPIVCFVGMSVLAVVALYLSLFIPLSTIVKLSLQVPILLLLLGADNRRLVILQLGKAFSNLSVWEFIFLVVTVLMILVLSVAPVIHPDTLAYHAFSTAIFEKFGYLKGIANIKPEFGFQSLWFTALAFFNFSFSSSVVAFTLNGCVMVWFVIFLTMIMSAGRNKKFGAVRYLPIGSSLILVLFCILSWTQIRLTASSLSPDFIAAISVLLGFYFFAGEKTSQSEEQSDLLAVFFSVIAVSIKMSVVPVLLIPVFIISRSLKRAGFLILIRLLLTGSIVLIPVIVRNFLCSGYPFYPSSIAPYPPVDWRVSEFTVNISRQYITAYARYPISRTNTITEYQKSVSVWLPLWWRNLYFTDKALILCILIGLVLNLVLLGKTLRTYSQRSLVAFLIALCGFVFWFIGAPDPRFGSAFLFALIFFLYFPFLKNNRRIAARYLIQIYRGVLGMASLLILLYTGYRLMKFFHADQILCPNGISAGISAQSDCESYLKKAILEDIPLSGQLPDSCNYFILRGVRVDQGFKPRH